MSEYVRIVPTSITASTITEGEPIAETVGRTEVAQPFGIKVRRPVDDKENNELIAIAALRDGLPEGAEVVEGTWQAVWAGYITEEDKYDEIVASDVRGVLLPVVYKYERRTGTQTKIIGEWWVASVLVWPSSIRGSR